ncbi:hypothetical protein CLOBOL_02788 [Enterocloster bolteae ATCC BAA-613]|uniref:Uncharacterized protein n=1 Tax=Enterocloster bolteae (strain ATCC BAA-613 / DSM 15670 / CCUG 46953 / JCM 12243 / WAL 16351) TaxID=411902 RepID=A8RQN7_ENTBW|nr:hypothetical protein CLOBOL_02788 [Enterocloster bolteae ATCC BAA-613]
MLSFFVLLCEVRPWAALGPYFRESEKCILRIDNGENKV